MFTRGLLGFIDKKVFFAEFHKFFISKTVIAL